MSKITLRAFTNWLVIIKMFTVSALIFGFANAAHAGGKLVTPGLSLGFNSKTLCSVVNAGADSVTVQITIFDGIDTVRDSVTWEIPPNNSRLLSYDPNSTAFLHCVIDVIEGKKQKLRGTFSVSDSVDGFRDSVEAR